VHLWPAHFAPARALLAPAQLAAVHQVLVKPEPAHLAPAQLALAHLKRVLGPEPTAPEHLAAAQP